MKELQIVRRHLRDREQPLSSDVAEAIYRIVKATELGLPVAMTKMDVVVQLIDIAHEGEEGEPDAVPIPAARRAMTNDWFNRLSNSAVFQAGYKHYEAAEKYGNLPVVPVTDYFFKHIYGDGAVADVLDAMSSHELMHSLPKRPGRVPTPGTSEEYLRDDNGEIATYGELAGLIVFPPNSRAALLRRWLERRKNVAVGQVEAAVGSIEHARPGAIPVEHLKEKINSLGATAAKALPLPPKNKS